MTWQGDPRTSTPEWRKKRLVVLRRDRRRCGVCGEPGANVVDHIVARSLFQANDPAADALTNLQAICDPCHKKKTAAEGVAARAAKAASRWNPKERHPGLVDPDDHPPTRGAA